MLGTPIKAIIMTKGRELFARVFREVRLPGGLASSEEKPLRLVQVALVNSPQVIVDESLKSWKELEYKLCKTETITALRSAT